MQAKVLAFAVVFAASTYIGCAAPGAEEEGGVTSDELAMGKANTEGFHDIPRMTDEERAAVLAKYENIHHEGIRQALYENAILYYDTNLEVIQNKKYLSVYDFSKHSKLKRFYIMDMSGGAVTSYVVAHGQNSDPDDNGVATLFGNVEGSFKSSLGFYTASELYTGVHGLSIRMDGLSDTNSNVRQRAIVIHDADYVEDGRAKQGMSNGCFAFSHADKPGIIDRLNGGSVIYANK